MKKKKTPSMVKSLDLTNGDTRQYLNIGKKIKR